MTRVEWVGDDEEGVLKEVWVVHCARLLGVLAAVVVSDGGRRVLGVWTWLIDRVRLVSVLRKKILDEGGCTCFCLGVFSRFVRHSAENVCCYFARDSGTNMQTLWA